MNLVDIQKRFEEATEKEYWSRLHDFLCSDKKESVASPTFVIPNTNGTYCALCSATELMVRMY